jgi:nucleotide-binding universal stress UspA family protein
MWGRIIVGTDGSPAAQRAGEVAATIARATRARLVAATGVNAPGEADPVLAAALDAFEAAGMRRNKLESVAVQGRPGDALVAAAEDLDAGLIAVSRGAGQPLSDLSRWLMRHAPCDLLLAAHRRAEPHAPYGRILIASAGTATADRAARKGFDLARELFSKVTLTFVGHPSTGQLVLEDTVEVYGRGIETDIRISQGEIAQQILRVADEVDAELVVIGNHGLQGVRGLLGSVPQAVIEDTDRDVLLCRTVAQLTSELGAGEGGIVERRGEKIAVYVDQDGEQHFMSARCTHMGCTVAWNPGEGTFDCPCHGSRFSNTGEVVNGPATRPLPPL